MTEQPISEPQTPPAPHWSTVGIFIILAVSALILARDFLMPVVLAFLLSLTFSPIRRWLGRAGVPDGLSASIITLSLLIALIAGTVGLSQPIRSYAEDAPRILQQVKYKLRDVNKMIEKVSKASKQVEKLTTGAAEEGKAAPKAVVVEEPSVLRSIAFGTPYFVAQIGLTLVLLFFLMSSGEMFYQKIVQVSPTFRDKRRAVEITKEIERKLSRYFLTVTIINAGLGAAIAIGFALQGMPNPVLFGVMAFILNFIPFLGAMGGIAISFAIALVSLPTIGTAVVVAGTYLALTTIEGQFLTPYAVGRNLKLNPVIVFISVAFWGWAWSVIGMFVAVPLLLLLKTLAEAIPSLNALAVFLDGLADKPAPQEADAR